jgi:hypothetical protein
MSEQVRVIVTGSRRWTNPALIEAALDRIAPIYGDRLVIVHGAARGADTIARAWAIRNGIRHEPHPAKWNEHRGQLGGNPAGVIRNQEMVDAGAHLVIAFPLAGGRGTQDCMARAEQAHIPV